MGTKRNGDPALASRLRKVLRGDVLFDAFDRGRYSTDASIYQIEPIGVALPKSAEDIEAAPPKGGEAAGPACAGAGEEGFPFPAGGGGGPQNGQTGGEAWVRDGSRY